MECPKVAVIGAGRMGSAIAYVVAASGRSVTVFDAYPEALQRLRPELDRIAGVTEVATGSVAVSTDLRGAVDSADLVIETVSEDLGLKQEIFEHLSHATSPATILATNTSSFRVTDVSARVTDRERVVGMHFWNPPYLVPLVEISRTAHTAQTAVERAAAVATSLGMEPVRVERDVIGLIGNRLQHALKREAIALVAAGVCDAETIDTVVTRGFGPRMAVLGPLEQSDLVGLDLTLAIHQSLLPDLDVTPRPHPYLVQKVADGHTGIRTGQGFRSWTPESAADVQRRLDLYLKGLRAQAARPSRDERPATA